MLTSAEVTVAYEPGSLEVEIVNGLGTGKTGGTQRPVGQEGLGLRGMAERAALYGGRVETTTEDNRFRVTAWFPLEATDS